MNKKLIILTGYSSEVELREGKFEGADLLAMTPMAMLTLSASRKEYFTFNDFYPIASYRQDNPNLIKDTEILFDGLDKKYENHLGFPNAFTSNIYYFLLFFADLLYLGKVSERLKEKYGDIYLIDNIVSQNIKENNRFNNYQEVYDFLTLVNDYMGISKIRNKINILNICLPGMIKLRVHYTNLNNLNSDNKLSSGKKRVNFYNKLIKGWPSLLTRCLRRISANGKPDIMVMQDGYEVGCLKRFLSKDFNFISLPIENLINALKEDNLIEVDKSIYKEELNAFIEKWFPMAKTIVFEIFDNYHTKILCNLSSFRKRLEELINKDRPVALFYSIGSNIILENVACFIAEKQKIPVFYFQHAGSGFSNYPYKKFIDFNNRIKKINILYSKAEYEIEKKNITEGFMGGSINLFNIYDKNKQRKKVKEILYTPSAFNSCLYRDLLMHIPDEDIYSIHTGIMTAVEERGLKMDIKIHPTMEEGVHYSYFNKINEILNLKNIKVLRGFDVEEIIGQYNLIVMDYILSQVLYLTLVLDIPIVFYLKDSTIINESALADFNKQFYIVSNKKEFSDCLDLYKAKKLKSKFNLDIIDKYAFPGGVNPVLKISEFITQRIKNGN